MKGFKIKQSGEEFSLTLKHKNGAEIYIDLDEDYCKIAEARIKAVQKGML